MVVKNLITIPGLDTSKNLTVVRKHSMERSLKNLSDYSIFGVIDSLLFNLFKPLAIWTFCFLSDCLGYRECDKSCFF